MEHLYAILTALNIAEGISKGRNDYDQPQNNRSIRYSLDESKVLVEGLYTDEERAWFKANAILTGDAFAILTYITANRVEWEIESVEV